MIRVPVPPKMLRWACERAGHDVAYVAERVPQLWARTRRENAFAMLRALNVQFDWVEGEEMEKRRERS